MNDSIMEKMADSEGKNVKLIFKDGKELEGYVDVYESRYDNDGDASICFAGNNGDMLIVEESELENIVDLPHEE